VDGTYSTLEGIRPARGKVDGDSIRYPGAFTDADDRYEVRAGWIKHDLILRRPPHLNDKPGFLEYVGELTLGDGLALFGEGGRLSGSFETSEPILVGTQEGQTWFFLDRPLAVEEGRPRATPGRYRVRPLSSPERSYEVRIQVPAAWLLDPRRRYPVSIDPTTVSWNNPVLTGCLYYEGGIWNLVEQASYWRGTQGASISGFRRYDCAIGRDYDWNNEFFRSWSQWSTRSIPLGSTVSQVRLKLRVAPYSYEEFDRHHLQIQVRSIEKRWEDYLYMSAYRYDDCGDGPLYHSGVLLRTGQGYTPWLTLAHSAAQRIESTLADGWFAAGFTWDQSGDRGVIAWLHQSLLRITYNRPPGGLAPLTPPPGARTIGKSVSFSWQAASDPDGDALSYSLYCDTDPTPSTLLYQGPSLSYTWGAPLRGSTYRWRVEVRDGTTLRLSPTLTFRHNALPPPPIMLFPLSGGTLSDSFPLLLWGSGGTDPDGDSVSYHWRIVSTPPLAPPLVAEGVTAANYALVPNLPPGSTFSWTLRALDAYESGEWTDVRVFQVVP